MRSQIAAGTIAYALASTVCRLHVAHILLRLLRGCRDVDMPIQSLDLHIDPEDRQIHPLPERWTLSLLRLNGCSGTLCQFIKALNETFAADEWRHLRSHYGSEDRLIRDRHPIRGKQSAGKTGAFNSPRYQRH